MNDHVIVTGGGLGALTAACTLAARKHRVTMLEKNPWLGGKATRLEVEGYRFDMGPTILTLPKVLNRVFEEAGKKVEEYLELVRLDPQWRCFYEDGSRLDLIENVEAMAESVGSDGDGYRRFQLLARRLHEISQKYFFWKPVGSVWDILGPNMATMEGFKSFLDMRPGKTVFQTVRSFVQDPRLAQMLDHFVQYVGSSPEGAPAVLCGIAHMQTQEGVWYPMGGTTAVARALARLAGELGVEVRTETEVGRILVQNGAVEAVETTKGERIPARLVVSNMDSVRTFRELVGGPQRERFEKKRKYEPACSGVVLFLGLKRRYPQLLHHCFVFSRDPHEEFHSIYTLGEPAPDPSLYLAAPAVTEPGVAPPGGEALYVLVHTPYLRPHHDWSKMLPGYRRVILDKLCRTCGIDPADLEENITVERVMTPQDIHDRYRVLDGAIYGLASHGHTNGAFKPCNRTEVQGLYLAGGAAHPGPGMPMVMMSGWIAADALHQDVKGARLALV